MPKKGKYGKYLKHCTTCVFRILTSNGYVYCKRHMNKCSASYVCDEYISRRTKKGQEIMKQLKY